VIAAVNGTALGGGTELALASDLVVAEERAKFGLPEVKRGLIAGAGGVFRIVAQLPQKLALYSGPSPSDGLHLRSTSSRPRAKRMSSSEPSSGSGSPGRAKTCGGSIAG
jgi:enoyl-CoA hydratase/carnithine racemase